MGAPHFTWVPGYGTAAQRRLSVQKEPHSPFPRLQVPEIVQYIYHNLYSITETTAQDTVKQVLHLLAQTYTDEVILTLFKMQNRSPR